MDWDKFHQAVPYAWSCNSEGTVGSCHIVLRHVTGMMRSADSAECRLCHGSVLATGQMAFSRILVQARVQCTHWWASAHNLY